MLMDGSACSNTVDEDIPRATDSFILPVPSLSPIVPYVVFDDVSNWLIGFQSPPPLIGSRP